MKNYQLVEAKVCLGRTELSLYVRILCCCNKSSATRNPFSSWKEHARTPAFPTIARIMALALSFSLFLPLASFRPHDFTVRNAIAVTGHICSTFATTINRRFIDKTIRAGEKREPTDARSKRSGACDEKQQRACPSAHRSFSSNRFQFKSNFVSIPARYSPSPLLSFRRFFSTPHFLINNGPLGAAVKWP